MLAKLESGLLYLMRVVMVVLVLFTLFTFVMWAAQALRPDKTAQAAADANKTRDWAAVKISDEELKKTTYSDFGYGDADQALNDGKLAADAAIATAFADVDASVRAAIERNPAARQKLEKDNSEAGLAPAAALADVVKALQAKERALYDNTTEPTDAAAQAVARALLHLAKWAWPVKCARLRAAKSV